MSKRKKTAPAPSPAPDPNPDAWKLPNQVTALDVAFGGALKHIVPPESAWPEDVREGRSPWLKVASDAFFETAKTLTALKVKPEFDRAGVIQTLVAVLVSWHYKHEIKEAQVATLMSLWCEL